MWRIYNSHRATSAPFAAAAAPDSIAGQFATWLSPIFPPLGLAWLASFAFHQGARLLGFPDAGRIASRSR